MPPGWSTINWRNSPDTGLYCVHGTLVTNWREERPEMSVVGCRKKQTMNEWNNTLNNTFGFLWLCCLLSSRSIIQTFQRTNAFWKRCHPGRLKRLERLKILAAQILCWSRCQSIMKWVFMQPCTQFKLLLSLSTDRICNQSPTQGPGGTRCSNEIRGKTQSPQRIEPTSLKTFYKFSSFFSCNSWWVLTTITRSSVVLLVLWDLRGA